VPASLLGKQTRKGGMVETGGKRGKKWVEEIFATMARPPVGYHGERRRPIGPFPDSSASRMSV